MNPEKEKAWNDGFQAGLKEIKSMLESELSSPLNEEEKSWVTNFLSKVSRIIEK